MEQFGTKLEVARKELEAARKELEAARKELGLAHKSFEKATNTDSSENHATPELMQVLYAIFLDEPALSDEEIKSLIKALGILNKRRTKLRDGATVGRV